ncbi:MAG: EpsG family protein, partial [Clostridia bacterium]|nr:EpsG family protein [Clostridia bacterium]
IGRLSFSEMLEVGNEQLFNIIVWGAYQIMPGNFVFHNVVMSILIYGLAIKTIRKLTKDVIIAILFYMLICYAYAFNGTRQMLAAMLCFSAYPFLEKKKYIPYFIVLFLASKIHITVLLIFPFFFLGELPFNNRKLVLCEILVIFFSLYITKYWDKVMEFLSFLEMDKLVEDYQDITRAYGTKFIRVFVKIPIVAVALWRYPTLKKNDTDGRLNYILNMSIFSVIFTIAGLRIVNLARFSEYFSIYQCLLITRLFKSMNIRQEQVILSTCMIICYILMWIVLLHVDSELLPYKLENGKVFN